MTYPSAPEPDQPHSHQPPVYPPAPPTPPVSGQPYGQPPQYGAPYAQNPYGQPDPYAQPNPYGQTDPYAQPNPYGQTDPYAQPSPYAQPGPYGQPMQPPQPQTTNGFAIASLIFGILGGILFGVIFGIVALSQIRKRNQKGKGLAVAGLSLSAAWLLVCGGVVAAAIITGDDPADGTSTLPNLPSVSKELKVGDCFNGLLKLDLNEELRSNPPKVACSEPHEGEVFHVVRVTGSTFPGDTEIQKQAESGCSETALSAFAPDEKTKDLEIYYLYPTSRSWTLGDRDITCLIVNEKAKLTGSLRG